MNYSRSGMAWLILGLVLAVPLIVFIKYSMGGSRGKIGYSQRGSAGSAFRDNDRPGPTPASAEKPAAAESSQTTKVSPQKEGLPPASRGSSPIAGGGGPSAGANNNYMGSAAPQVNVSSATRSGDASSETEESSVMDLQRDPTLSMKDKKRLEEIALQKELERQRALEANRVKGPASIEEKIRLEGIIATRNNVNAIVNGEKVRQGESVLGAVILRITFNCVEFKHKDKTFRKCIGR